MHLSYRYQKFHTHNLMCVEKTRTHILSVNVCYHICKHILYCTNRTKNSNFLVSNLFDMDACVLARYLAFFPLSPDRYIFERNIHRFHYALLSCLLFFALLFVHLFSRHAYYLCRKKLDIKNTCVHIRKLFFDDTSHNTWVIVTDTDCKSWGELSFFASFFYDVHKHA